MTQAQRNLFEQQPTPTPPVRRETREIVTRAALAVKEAQQHQEPPAPDWTAYSINPDSIYADDEQEAAALAQQCAVELKGHIFGARLLRLALKTGRNPLYKGAPPFTEKQTKQLTEDAAEAEALAAGTYSQCVDAFGGEDAGRLYEYALACVAAVVPDELPEEATREPQQAALNF